MHAHAGYSGCPNNSCNIFDCICASIFVCCLTGKVSVKSTIFKFGTERFVLAGESVTPGQRSTFVCRLLGCFCLMI
jgi:hypothetical protein